MTHTPTTGAVVCEHTTASAIGAEILKAGGNAVDALIAAVLAVGVLSPYHSCIGGGGFVLVRTPEKWDVIDFRSCAPAATTMDNFMAHSSPHGGHAVAVPGEIKGLYRLHQQYGKAEWASLFAPSVKLSRGARMGRDLYDFIARECPNAPRIEGSWMADDPEFVRAFSRDGRLIQVGEVWAREDYADVLEAIGERGPEAFYGGEVAGNIVKAVQGRGGVMSLDDLKKYTPVNREPLSTTFRGHEVFSVPAPASGAALLGALKTLDSFPLSKPLSVEDEHVTVEAMRLAFGARTELGDPAYVPVDAVQAAMLRGAADRVQEKTQAPEYYLPGAVGVDDNGTSSMAAADASGLVVSLTTTVGTAWASRIMVPGTGIVLNDSVLDFTVKGRPNVWGYAPAPANFVAGSRRPLSSMCPYIVLKDGEPVAVGGAAGGATIPSANILAVRNMLAYNLGAGEALAQPRIHNQVLPNVTVLEQSSDRGRRVVGLGQDVVRGLEERGHVVEWCERSRATPCAMRILPDGYDTGGDARKWDAGGAVCVGGKVVVQSHPA
ncbi:hypothetical protein CcaverHIS002_0100310 [Cutaneotrichosporon cavernicola]|uniref:Gamma-glutamyltranspeptidase n=1 Tax=Cutaneotrichosporon cavernicola TaxID=279322 RepID=A0AA48HXJ0_9TREE|nr:uncharacterized protein CcaverHIS019_0100290 [Cutaneotrichosporon cavernicola]BEI79502.1 hypothetical protein CcaverHIS002_0100310 [Cutaneotrichosporon cavernicola]BEI87311.1 hypothetical protein CcaverHIS019_0100290 [Cutaneotrichosporon cavernicola]BEI95081.1 hypothetical protein CcaverHIS631_0100300 [Cutaneotrichosporon cavernicola]BEJ02855.1 hypothetical protein CcaverHIS641_0100300 [Cutaneotrichosporon cavernicola]